MNNPSITKTPAKQKIADGPLNQKMECFPAEVLPSPGELRPAIIQDTE